MFNISGTRLYETDIMLQDIKTAETDFLKEQRRLFKVDSNTVSKKNKDALDRIFYKSEEKMHDVSVIESDNQIAMSRLRALTTQMQVKKLRQKSKSFCDYFIL